MGTTQKILMCPPDFFGVEYIINPWMEGHKGEDLHIEAAPQWQALYKILSGLVDVVLMDAQPHLPDLVFTANAGLVLGKKAIVSRFRKPERQGEEPFFLDWFKKDGFEIIDWPQDVAFEGAGDALFDRGQKSLLWVGHGFRSDERAPAMLERYLGCKTATLHLVDPRWYHLDTCLCPLSGGYLMYYPAAFDAASVVLIKSIVPESKLIEVGETDALAYACNAVDVAGKIVMNAATTDLHQRLTECGFDVITTPLTMFLRAGGAAKCLTLKLVEDQIS